MNLKDRIQFGYEGGLTERFHTRPGLRRNTNAAHSHGVAMMCFWLASEKPSAALLMAALTHDTAEQVVGDVPAPTKWAIGAETLDRLEEDARMNYGLRFVLTENERRQLALADALDGLLYCSTELTLGNQRVRLMSHRWVVQLEKQKASTTPPEWDVVKAVFAIWEEATRGEEPQLFSL